MMILHNIFVASIIMMVIGSIINGFGRNKDQGDGLVGIGFITFLISFIWLLFTM